MQNSLFDFPQIQIDKPIRLIELFGGIGSQAMALRDLGADFESHRLVEYDRFAVKSYNAIHGTSFEPTDIRLVHGEDLGITQKERYCYLLTYSFPCTDLSIAGKMQGMSKKQWKDGNSTRSGLLWEVERILKELNEENLPDILVMENVPQVHGEANRLDFEEWLSFLRGRGYMNFWKDLNAKDYGVPQNRDRCFCVSVLAKDFVDFEFPKPVPLEKVMKDFLEDKVDEKFYVNGEKAQRLIAQFQNDGKINDTVIGGFQKHQTARTDGISPSLTAAMGTGGGQTPLLAGCCMETVSTNGRDNIKKIDVAKALTARDSKGFSESFQTSNGVKTRTVDLTINSPKETQVANCIPARYDCGISNQKSSGNGVLECQL